MKTRKQYAALPFIVTAGRTEVLLITSRESHRWIIPKGWPKKSLAAHKLAALEAFEEAGIAGHVSKLPIGRFKYIKIHGNNSKSKCDVEVFGLEVDRQYLEWPEKGEREYRWMSVKKASGLVKEKELKKLLRSFRPNHLKKRR